MSFTTEDLINLGLSDEQAKNVFALHGKDLNANKELLKSIEQEKESLENQLQKTEAKLEDLKKSENTSEEQKKAFEELQAEYNKYKQETADEIAKNNKVNAIKLALKDTNAHNSDALMKFINIDDIEVDDNGKPQIEKVINDLKESDSYLFKQEDSKTAPNIILGGNPNASNVSEKSDPFQEIIESYQNQT